ncbi:hypothetical protein BRYFOR_05988 [Marvinbryantia formatexigens DSM 14469]|uniref:Uncharacterized protein n=1 Tax=Marvinbryantia formatexigens DSM 14469 TaxID=478749 RepID=C6LBJ3_9FIRM|nr:hypothetical protein BRYFOR_05988 [Marvinbryantia formatexigens DSM 14469]
MKRGILFVKTATRNRRFPRQNVTCRATSQALHPEHMRYAWRFHRLCILNMM